MLFTRLLESVIIELCHLEFPVIEPVAVVFDAPDDRLVAGLKTSCRGHRGGISLQPDYVVKNDEPCCSNGPIGKRQALMHSEDERRTIVNQNPLHLLQ
jgi:hypothetical protein